MSIDVVRTELMVKTAVFGDVGRYRYSLSRVWEPAAPQLCWIMMNPSIASAEIDDPTIRRCIGFARKWKAGGIVVVNLFAHVATIPNDLIRAVDPVGPHNDEAIIQAVLGRRVICAWGDVWRGCLRHPYCDRDQAVRSLLLQTRTNPQCLGRTKFGAPSHPLYLPGRKRPRPFVLKDTGQLFQSIKGSKP